MLRVDATVIVRGQPTAVKSIDNRETLWLQGNNSTGHVSLTAAAGFSNAGTIRLESLNSNWSETLNVSSGTLLNTGTIQINSGTGGGRTINASITNEGTINVGTDFEVGGNPIFNMVSGAINVTAGSMVLTGGEFNWTGGEVNNDLYGRNTRWDVATTVSDTARLIARGSESRLGNNVSRNVTLWVQGGNDIGDATLTADAGLVNHGTIVLESINSNWQSNLTVSGGELQNAFDGVIQVNTGTGGGRNLTGSVTNEGTINVGTGFEVGGNPIFNMVSGAINVTAGSMVLTGGEFNWTGGEVNNDLYGRNTRWDVATTVSDRLG